MDKSKSFIMAERLKDLREKKGLSHESLSKTLKEKYDVNVSSDSLMNYEVSTEHRAKAFANEGMRISYLRTLADFYDVSADWILGLSDTKSIDPNIKIVTQYTGLTEENASFLHDPSALVGDDEPLNLSRKSYFMLVNDLLHFCRSTDARLYFLQIQHVLSLFKGKKTPYSGHVSNQLLAEGISSNRGYAVLPVNDSISFYASLVAQNIAEAIENKYRVPEKTEPEGILEIMEINGKKVKFYKE